MAGTLTASVGAASFRFDCLSPTRSAGSTSRVYIGSRYIPKASLHAVVEEPKVKSRSLYDVLCVKRNATSTEIKSAYRSLAKRYHPDASGNDLDFIDIHNAYSTLSDPTARALYDLKSCVGLERRSGGLYTSAGSSSAFYTGRRWETDQCW